MLLGSSSHTDRSLSHAVSSGQKHTFVTIAEMLGPVTERFSITKSFGIGKANFGFWDPGDCQDDDIFFEEPVITELVLQTKVGPGFSVIALLFDLFLLS